MSGTLCRSRVSVITDLHEVLTDFAGCGPGLRTEGIRQRLNDRVENAASSSSGRRHSRRNDQFGQRDGITKGQRRTTDVFNNKEGNTTAETSFDKCAERKNAQTISQIVPLPKPIRA